MKHADYCKIHIKFTSMTRILHWFYVKYSSLSWNHVLEYMLWTLINTSWTHRNIFLFIILAFMMKKCCWNEMNARDVFKESSTFAAGEIQRLLIMLCITNFVFMVPNVDINSILSPSRRAQLNQGGIFRETRWWTIYRGVTTWSNVVKLG